MTFVETERIVDIVQLSGILFFSVGSAIMLI
jgi:hypothetical protein